MTALVPIVVEEVPTTENAALLFTLRVADPLDAPILKAVLEPLLSVTVEPGSVRVSVPDVLPPCVSKFNAKALKSAPLCTVRLAAAPADDDATRFKTPKLAVALLLKVA